MMPHYPSHWWNAVPARPDADWEVLPQAAVAGSGEVILSKRHELGVLSNFTEAPFTFRGKRYRSIEGWWQMMFFPEGPNDPRAQAGLKWPHTREEVAQMVAFEAKLAGDVGFANMQALNIDWITFEGRRMKYWDSQKGEHYHLVVEAMQAKLEQNPQVRNALISTGDLRLLPDHRIPPDAPPSWRYFEIWMELRGKLTARG